MPKICKRCNKKFPYNINIDGKNKNLGNRKFCLECSPFGKHNTRNISKSSYESIGSKRICSLCEKEFVYSREKGHRLNICGSCSVSNFRRKLKSKCIEYKGGKCQNCGYNKSQNSLDFHHLDPKQKEFAISGMSISWIKIKKEVDKCIVVCKNCHGEIHEELHLNHKSEIINNILHR